MGELELAQETTDDLVGVTGEGEGFNEGVVGGGVTSEGLEPGEGRGEADWFREDLETVEQKAEILASKQSSYCKKYNK